MDVDGNDDIKIGICTIAFKERSLAEIAATAAKWGFDGIEVWGRAGHTEYPPNLDEHASFRNTVEDLGLSIPVFSSYLNPASPNWDESVGNDLAITSALGSAMIRVWAGDSGSATADGVLWDMCIGSLREFSKRAQGRGVRVCVERHSNTLTDETEAAFRLIEEIDHPNLGLNWQGPYGQERIETADDLDRLAAITTHVHAQTVVAYPNKPGDRIVRTTLREGVIDWPLVISKLSEVSYTGWIMVEFVADKEPDAAAADDCHYLHECLATA